MSRRCMSPPFDDRAYVSRDIGIKNTNGRCGEVSVETCTACGNLWLRYVVENESFSRSRKWYRGLMSPGIASTLTPANATDVLRSLPWRVAGGSYFDSTGFRITGTIDID